MACRCSTRQQLRRANAASGLWQKALFLVLVSAPGGLPGSVTGITKFQFPLRYFRFSRCPARADGMIRLDTIFDQPTNRRVRSLVEPYMRREKRLIRREEHAWSLTSVSPLTPLTGASDAATLPCPAHA